MNHRLLLRRLVVMSPLIAPPSCLPRLVVASLLVAPPWPLNAPAATSRCAISSPCAGASTSCLPLIKNTPPAPGRIFFWTPGANVLWADKDGSNAWFLIGWCVVSHPPARAKKPESWVCLCYCTFEPNWQPSPWMSRISCSSQSETIVGLVKKGLVKKNRSSSWGMVWWWLLAKICLVVDYLTKSIFTYHNAILISNFIQHFFLI